MHRMGSSFSPYILALLSLLLFVSTRPADAKASKIVRGLNLSPRLDANIVNDDPLASASKIVEKRFQFPLLISDSGTARSTGATVADLGHYAGYYRLCNTNNRARMFYYFIKSRKNDKNAPVVVYLTGGPGFTGSMPLLYENGPFHLTKHLSLDWNNYGWDKEANIIFVDQPTGTGFSYSTKKSDIRNTSEEAAVDFYNFLMAFFENHPEYLKNEFYIAGESYAGHYIPAFATLIHKENKKKQGLHINLKGLAIASAWTYPGLQFTSYPDYALKMKLINHIQYKNMTKSFSLCQKQVHKACDGTHYDFSDCAQANIDCNDILWDYIITPTGGKNYYDIRKKCKGLVCYDFSNMERFLNQTSVKKALGVAPNISFVSWSAAVNDAMAGDQMRNLAIYIPALLQDGIKLLVYGGEYDLLCNWIGNWRWIADMKWSGRKGILSAPYVRFKVGRRTAGWLKSNGPLIFLRVKNAGHMVPMDQPEASLEMLRRWIEGIPL